MIADLKADSERWLAEKNKLPHIVYQASQTHQFRQYYGPTSYDKSPSYQQGFRTYSDAGDKSNAGPANIASSNTSPVPYNSSTDYRRVGSGTGIGGFSSVAPYHSSNQTLYSSAGLMPPEASASQGIQNTYISSSPQPQATLDLSRSKEL
jgi:hypothetical protein